MKLPPLAVNNDIYNQLGERWYTAKDDPVALLRAEAQCRDPWVVQIIRSHFKHAKIQALDVGCGGGFLSNRLAREGHYVTGIDLSEESLEVARRYDPTRSVRYQSADVYSLPMSDCSFDVVCAMDFLEHVDRPEASIHEMSRVLKPGGLLFFHTFNRNPIANFVVIKLVEWLVKNTPPQMHVSNLFIKPQELEQFCRRSNLHVAEMRGLRPNLLSRSALKSIWTGSIEEGFNFVFVNSLLISYCGYAKKLTDLGVNGEDCAEHHIQKARGEAREGSESQEKGTGEENPREDQEQAQGFSSPGNHEDSQEISHVSRGRRQ